MVSKIRQQTMQQLRALHFLSQNGSLCPCYYHYIMFLPSLRADMRYIEECRSHHKITGVPNSTDVSQVMLGGSVTRSMQRYPPPYPCRSYIPSSTDGTTSNQKQRTISSCYRVDSPVDTKEICIDVDALRLWHKFPPRSNRS